jgi:hypothetical protein
VYKVKKICYSLAFVVSKDLNLLNLFIKQIILAPLSVRIMSEFRPNYQNGCGNIQVTFQELTDGRCDYIPIDRAKSDQYRIV